MNRTIFLGLAAARLCKGDYKYSSSVTSTIKDLELEPLASPRKLKPRLCTMYEISNDIIHVNKSRYLTPATEIRTRTWIYRFKIF